MSLNHLEYARNALIEGLKGLEFANGEARQEFEKSLFLRPPKEKSWGDLCTNAAILLKKDAEISFEQAAAPVIAAFEAEAPIQSVTVSGNGYINLTFHADFWRQALVELNRDMPDFGFDRAETRPREVAIAYPEKSEDLVEARQQANADILTRLAALAGWQVREVAWPPHEAETMALAPVIAKCGAANTRFALIANPPAFTRAFSLNLAIDKSYDNPVFCIAYARQRAGKLTAGVYAGEGEGQAPDLSALEGTMELMLIKRLCHWPLAVERSLEKQDVFYLTAFLHDISLLFFRLVETVRPVSSSYLQDAGAGAARVYLLTSVETVLTGALDILGIPATKEFE